LGGCNRNANSTAESGNTVETDLSLSTDADGSFSDSAMHPYLEALEWKLELRDDGIAYRYFNEDTTRYRLFPDTLFNLENKRVIMMFRCVPGDDPCCHAEAARFQLVEYHTIGKKPRVLRQSSLLPVYSPWCDKLSPTLIRLKGIPHLFFKMSDGHQESSREEYWMISLSDRNFGATVWKDVIYTSGLKEGHRDDIGVFPVEEMEAFVEFDSSRCEEGIWALTISKIITKRLSNVCLGEPSPESEERVRNTPPVAKESEDMRVYRMDGEGRLVEENISFLFASQDATDDDG